MIYTDENGKKYEYVEPHGVRRDWFIVHPIKEEPKDKLQELKRIAKRHPGLQLPYASFMADLIDILIERLDK